MQRKKIENTCKRHCGTKQLLGVTLVAALEATSGLRILASTLRAVGLVVAFLATFVACPVNKKKFKLIRYHIRCIMICWLKKESLSGKLQLN